VQDAGEPSAIDAKMLHRLIDAAAVSGSISRTSVIETLERRTAVLGQAAAAGRCC